MNFLDAAYTILKQSDIPLHYAEITRRAIAKNILDTKGKTPEASMGARLYVDTKNSNSRFKRISRNIFGLATQPAPEIIEHITAINIHSRNQLRQNLLQMPPHLFEALIGELLLALGFEEDSIEVTSYSNDGGIDVKGVLNAGNITEIKVAVQVKRWKNNISAPTVQALRGSLTVHQQGIIITTSKFSKGAIEEANAIGKTVISLVDGDKLLDLLFEHKIGVKAESYTLYTIDDEFWKNIIESTKTDLSEPAVSTDGVISLETISYPLTIQTTFQGQTFFAELLSAKGKVRFNNQEYTSPSLAGQVVTGWKSCNGWMLWHYQHPITQELKTIDELRNFHNH